MTEKKRTSSYKGYTQGRGQSSIAYAKRSLKRIPFDVQKDKYEEIKSAADKAGLAVNAYIKQAIEEKMLRDSNTPTA